MNPDESSRRWSVARERCRRSSASQATWGRPSLTVSGAEMPPRVRSRGCRCASQAMCSSRRITSCAPFL